MTEYSGPAKSRKLHAILHTLEALAKGAKTEHIEVKGIDGLSMIARKVNDLSDHISSKHDKMRRDMQKVEADRQRLMEQINSLGNEAIRSRKNSESGDRIKTEFIANVNHSLRTPLTSIAGFTSLLKDDECDEKEKRSEYVDIIQQESNRLLGMIETLIDLSILNTGDYHLALRIFNLNRSLSSRKEQWEIEANEKNVSIKLELDPRIDGISADIDMIMKMVDKLVFNAIEHSPNGSYMTIRTSASDESIFLEVIDNGPGIPREVQNTIFQDFVRRDKPSTIIGLGLGLSLVRSIARVHSGSIELDSKVGKGSCFRVVLPTAPLADTENSIEESGTQTGRKILVADDDTNSRRLILSMMKDDFQIVEASDGDEVLALAKTHQPVLIIVDLAMPVKDGFAAMEELREVTDTSDIPLLAVSALANQLDVDRAYECGASSFISKPFTKDELAQEIERLLSEVEE